MELFVGRDYELEQLKRLVRKGSASLVVIKGRRRIGKSRLVKEFADEAATKFYTFTGLPPTPETSAQDQRDHFSKRFSQQFGYNLTSDDWYDIFTWLGKSLSKERTVILFDEISWMGSKDHTFLGKLKAAWDVIFSQHPKLILILCGSVSYWIDKNIVSSKGFLGRINLNLTVRELSLPECNELLQHQKFDKSPMEKFMVLSVTGGVPWYIENIDGKQSAADNIKRLCFSEDGLLANEFKFIFNDLFASRRLDISRKIVECLASGPAEFKDIAKAIDYSASGALGDYLEELELAGFISQDFSWDLKTGEPKNISRYRLKDNYMQFYLRYIQPRLTKIQKEQYAPLQSIIHLPAWDSIMGLQFENLVLNNRGLVMQRIGINPVEVEFDNPYLQRKTSEQEGCQIDYLIQTRFKTLYVCEVKFSQKAIGPEVIAEVEQKIDTLKVPRNTACVPVLIYASEVSKALQEKYYFSDMVDFASLLQP